MSEKKLNLELEVFQGPFDLLLHLIKQMKVDINDIPMTEITTQYLTYLHSMKELELDIVGDYLVLASTLLEIKSRLLLPIEPDPEMDSDFDHEDPRQILVQQLLLYQQFQGVATALEVKQQQRAKLFTRPSEDLTRYQTRIPLEDEEVTLAQLSQAMTNALQRELEREPLQKEIHHDPLSVSDKIATIIALLKTLDEQTVLTFDDLIEQPTRHDIITTFMAVLELVRKQHIIFKQKNALEAIEIKKVEGADDTIWN